MHMTVLWFGCYSLFFMFVMFSELQGRCWETSTALRSLHQRRYHDECVAGSCKVQALKTCSYWHCCSLWIDHANDHCMVITWFHLMQRMVSCCRKWRPPETDEQKSEKKKRADEKKRRKTEKDGVKTEWILFAQLSCPSVVHRNGVMLDLMLLRNGLAFCMEWAGRSFTWYTFGKSEGGLCFIELVSSSDVSTQPTADRWRWDMGEKNTCQLLPLIDWHYLVWTCLLCHFMIYLFFIFHLSGIDLEAESYGLVPPGQGIWMFVFCSFGFAFINAGP